jgi:hypothetical protein
MLNQLVEIRLVTRKALTRMMLRLQRNEQESLRLIGQILQLLVLVMNHYVLQQALLELYGLSGLLPLTRTA